MLNTITLNAGNPGPMTGSGNHTYLVVNDNQTAMLIDAGVGDPRHLEALKETLETYHATLTDVLVTHGHPDHASGALAIANAHPHARFFKYPWPEEDRRYAVDWQPIAEGDVFGTDASRLQALHTPGHSPDHVAFWHATDGTVFTGDLVVQGSSVMIHATRGGDLGEYLQSLQRLLAMEPARVLPAHGPDIPDASALLRAYIEHRRMRERQVIAALQAGRADVRSIVESIYDDLAPPLLAAAAENVHAHLEKLRRDGRAREDDGRWAIASAES